MARGRVQTDLAFPDARQASAVVSGPRAFPQSPAGIRGRPSPL